MTSAFVQFVNVPAHAHCTPESMGGAAGTADTAVAVPPQHTTFEVGTARQGVAVPYISKKILKHIGVLVLLI